MSEQSATPSAAPAPTGGDLESDLAAEPGFDATLPGGTGSAIHEERARPAGTFEDPSLR